MKLSYALPIAQHTARLLEPHCRRLAIAGSVRRRCPEVGDIEIVAIPKAYDVGLFESGLALVVNKWEMVKGDLPCKYTQRILPQGIKLDLFMADMDNWGLIYAIRTGSAHYSHHVLATGWRRNGFNSIGGYLTRGRKRISVPEEKHLFAHAGVQWVPAHQRNL